MDTDGRKILVTGATGKQGGAVADELLKRGFSIRAMTRKPEAPAARALADRGAEVVQGDLDDAASLHKALAGIWGVWAVQNTWEAGVEREEEQGKRQARVAREAGVQHYVYTSVGSAHRKTGIPHFDNKWRVEEVVRSLNFPSHVILRPVFFMENLMMPGMIQGDKLTVGLDPATALQMIAVEDIGKFGALAFEKSGELNRAEIDLAGDSLTMPQVAAVLSKATGKPLEFQRVPLSEVRKFSEEYAVMLDWFDKVGYDADIPGLEKKYGIKLTRLADWAPRHFKR
jgi:uncharacterized protein YbjT (DUF2867 family)